jgi:two-component system cell cycle sensor histidine kinase/response regulator CckA
MYTAKTACSKADEKKLMSIIDEKQVIDVLLVADSSSDADFVQQTLRDAARFRLVHVQQLSDALLTLLKQKVSIVLLDLGLPDSDGLETLRKIKNVAQNVPVIVLTANDDEELTIHLAKEGAQKYLVKSKLHERNLPQIISNLIERDRSVKTLRESEQQLRAIISTAPQCIEVISPEGIVLEMNSAGLVMFDADLPEMMIGRSIFRFIAPEFETAYRSHHHSVCQGHHSTLEYDILGFKCNRRSLSCVSTPLLNHDGSSSRLSIAHDISKRKLAEAELYLHKSAIEAVSEGILITDACQPDDPIIYASPSFTQLSGYPLEEVLGKNCLFLQGADTDPDVVWQMQEAIQARQPCTVEVLNYRKDGQTFWNSISIAPITDRSGIVKHIVCVQTEVTERRELENQLRQSQKMEGIGQLAGGVAHDFNNLLTIILGSCAEIRSTETLSEYGADTLDDIHHASQRAADLTRQLLAFSRKQLLNPVVLNLNEIITNIHKMALRLIGEDIELSWQPLPALWPVKLDPGQIEQVVLNLIVNARDAMPQGGRLSIKTANVEWSEDDCRLVPDRKPGSYVVLIIGDSGTGIPPAVKSRIFEPFFTTKEAGKGTGLGLSVVHGIVKQSNGYIEVNSHVDKGTSFMLYFPAVKERVQIAENGQATLPLKAGTETILLVEDEEGVRKIARLALERQGYTVLEAGNGQEALAAADTHHGVIEMILTDVVMPVMSGRQLAKILSARFPRSKVIYMTGYTDDAIIRQGLSHDSHALLKKPFSMLELVQKVQTVMSEESTESSHLAH